LFRAFIHKHYTLSTENDKFRSLTCATGAQCSIPNSDSLARHFLIDAVRFLSHGDKTPLSEIVAFSKETREEFESIVNGANVEVIEVKKRLWRSVIGQIIGGTELLEIQYHPTKIHQVVICKYGDPLLEMICKKRKNKVWVPPVV
jgi:hypothetical protein